MKKLKTGDIFVVYSSELKYVALSRNGSFITSNINSLSDYSFPLVTFLCMYLGNNICEEYYSGIKMQVNYPITEGEYYISIYDKHNNEKTLNSVVDKWKDYHKLDKYVLEYPLIIEPIIINNTNQYVVSNDSSKENSIKLMKKLSEMAKLEYLKSKNEFISNQHDEAFLEDMCSSFQKRRIK